MTGTLRFLPETPDSLDALIEALKSLTVAPAGPRSPPSHETAVMDVLSDVLRVVRLSGAVFFTADFSSPWAIESPIPDMLASAVMPEAECIVLFHILVDGECEVECRRHPHDDDGERRCDRVPARRSAHDAQSGCESIDAAVDDLLARQARRAAAAVVRRGWTNVAVRVWLLNCDQRFSPLVDALPTMLLVRSRDDYSAIEAVDGNGSRPTAVPRGIEQLAGHDAEVHGQRSAGRASR